MDQNTTHKSGFIAVIGRPNVGKSTLINTLIGEKIAIMSDKPQTTRNRILCILTQPDAQIVFLDTPGIHKPRHKLGEYMVKSAENTLKEVDAIFFVVDATEKLGPGNSTSSSACRRRASRLSSSSTKSTSLIKKNPCRSSLATPNIIRSRASCRSRQRRKSTSTRCLRKSKNISRRDLSTIRKI